MIRCRKILIALLLVTSLLLGACSQAPPSRFEQAQQASTEGSQRNQAVSKQAEAGGSFNQFFPKAEGDFKLVYSQDKKGFAQAKLKQQGKDVAVLSISDTISTPDAKNKFQQSTENIKGYPVASQGTKGTALLVADRFQVKVLSRDTSFAAADREAWLAKFDLDGLANLK